MNCPVCSSANTRYVQNVHDDRYGYPGKFSLMCCPNCHHVYLDCALKPTQLGKLYTNYYPRKSFELAQYKPHEEKSGLDAWINGLNSSAFRRVPKHVRVLDVGCGFGESLGYHAARGCDVYGVEADENIKRVADKFGFKVHVGLFDPELYEPAFFDYVTMDQVIEHVTDPLETFRGIAKVLKPGGVAVLSTPNANGWGAKIFRNRWINWHAPYHSQFFSKKSLQLAAEQAGLKVTTIQTVTSSSWLLYQWIHLFTYPQPGMPSAFWDTTGEKSFRVKLLLSAASRIHKTKINHLITRLFDALDLGDNYLFILLK